MAAAAGVTECIIVGGGLLGMLSARALAHAGMEVCLLERGETCRESSWAGGGIISPLVPWDYPDAVTVLVKWSQRHYPLLAQELLDETGIDVERLESGMLMFGIGADPEILAWADKHGCRMQRLESGECHALEPGLADDLGAALLLPEVAQVRNPRLCRAMRDSLEHRGIEVHEHTAVSGLKVHGGAIQGVTTRRGDFLANRVVIAGGAWTSQLLEPTGIDLPVTPVRGQMILFQARPGLLQHIVLYRDHYLIPRRDGHILAGSTLEYTGYDKSRTAQARELLVGRATRLVPALEEVPVVRHWAGLRPGSPDNIPYIDEHPGIRGLFVNAGHFRNGVVMGPASARLLADRVLGRESFTAADPYLLDR